MYAYAHPIETTPIATIGHPRIATSGIENATAEVKALSNPPARLKDLPFDPLQYIEHLDELPFDPDADPGVGE